MRSDHIFSGLLAALLLLFSVAAQATAPRIAPQLFGEEKKADILTYRLSPLDSAVRAEDELLVRIVKEAFKEAGKSPVLDSQPAKQLAKYALFNGEVAALVGSPADFSDKEKKRYRWSTFYMRGGTASGEQVCLIFNKSLAAGSELQRAFDSGLRKLITSGKYREILEAHHGKGAIAADYLDSLKRYHPDWK